MKIKIAERLRPFCHLPGTACLIPWTSWKVVAYPTVLKFENLLTHETREQKLDWKGPVSNFTVELDLEKGVVWIYGHTAEGYRKHKIDQEADFSTSLERLSLGMSKKLDWELVRRRGDLREILPVWFRLGQMVPETTTEGEIRCFHQLFLTGFEGILSPRLEDKDHLGFSPILFTSPLALLREGSRKIRSLFFQQEGSKWSFLPESTFHAGRFIHLQTEEGDTLDFEWSKHLLRRVIIHAAQTREIVLELKKPLKTFRLNKKLRRVGSLLLEQGKTYFLDRFEK